MQRQITYKKAKKLNAVFILLLFAAENTASPSQEQAERLHEGQDEAKSQEYYNEKMKEFEREKYRF